MTILKSNGYTDFPINHSEKQVYSKRLIVFLLLAQFAVDL